MLDLPQPDQVRLPTSDNTSTGTAGLDRKGSLTRRVTSNTQSPLTTVSSTNGSTFPSTQQPSVGIVLGIDEYGIRSRQNTNMSNVTTTAGSDFSNTSIAFGTLNNINENNTSLKGVGGFSIDGYGNTGRNDQQQQQQAGNNTTAFGGTAFAPRRDSGYGHSIYNNTLSPPVAIGNFGPTGSDERRGSRSAVSVLYTEVALRTGCSHKIVLVFTISPRYLNNMHFL